jgi:CRP-like cAMP-binding protein
MSAVERLERSLRDIDLFRPLSDAERRTAAASFKRHHYARGERIIVEGEPGNSFFVIDTGEVEVLKNLGGSLRPIARLHEGQFFGEMALLTGADRAATVVAATDADMFAIDKAGFHGVLVANPGVAVDISRILAERQGVLTNAVIDVTERFGAGAEPARKDDLLKRIRSYFGL